jgi:hypothetical protein
MEVGTQPLDGLMEELGLANRDLVRASPSQLSHKVVGKARSGRRLTQRAQRKVLEAINCSRAEGAPFALGQLFNYRGR